MKKGESYMLYTSRGALSDKNRKYYVCFNFGKEYRVIRPIYYLFTLYINIRNRINQCFGAIIQEGDNIKP